MSTIRRKIISTKSPDGMETMDNSEEFVYRRDGEEAEIYVYAPDGADAERGFERVTRAASLPDVESPVWAVVSGKSFGSVAVSRTYLSLGLAGRPERGVLLSTEVGAGDLVRIFGVPDYELSREFERRVRDARVSVPRLSSAGVREISENGAVAAAELGLLEDEDLTWMDALEADSGAVGRRSISAGERDWLDRPGFPRLFVPGEVFDSERLEDAGLGGAVISLPVPSGEFGRIALGYHEERIAERVVSGRFDAVGDRLRGLHAAPLDSEEAEDALAACRAVANFADGLTALWIHVLRNSLGKSLGAMEIRAAWRTGNVSMEDGLVVHRAATAKAGAGEMCVCGANRGAVLCSGTGAMYGSVPTFDVPESDGRHVWEEVGLIERIARLESPG